MKTNFYKDISKKRINSIFKFSLKNPDEAWKRAFWSLSGILTIALFDQDINGHNYESLSCELYDYLEYVYSRESRKGHTDILNDS